MHTKDDVVVKMPQTTIMVCFHGGKSKSMVASIGKGKKSSIK
jgi:hypothetical protein